MQQTLATMVSIFVGVRSSPQPTGYGLRAYRVAAVNKTQGP